jgi:transcription-repair coupling factor (superfamily II helicase)
MELYRRIAIQETSDELASFEVELVDRFGPMPEEVKHLLEVMNIKQYCRQANIEKIDAGAKGAVLTFRNNSFDNPAGLVGYISKQPGSAKLRADHKMVYTRSWAHPEDRLKGVHTLARDLAVVASAP